jgi:hypothetical protein
MSDEQQTQEPAATTGNADVLQRSIEALERKNQELIAELRAAKKSKAPDGVNVDELLEFKRNYDPKASIKKPGKLWSSSSVRRRRRRTSALQNLSPASAS